MAPPLFSASRPPLLGVDISTTAVKLIELNRKGGQHKVMAYAIEPLAKGVVEDGAIRETEAVGQAIQRALKRSGTRNKLAAIALPPALVITKVIQMPAVFTEDEMEGQIRLEADAYIPYAIDECNIDFQVIGPTPGREDSVDVLLAASRSENVDERVGALDFAGLTARVVDVETFAKELAYQLLTDQMPQLEDGQLSALVEIGASSLGLYVFKEGEVIYNRDENFGGDLLIEEIMLRYGLSYEEASRARRQGDLPDDYERELLAPFRDRIAQQVFRGLQLFYGNTEYSQIEHLSLSGGCAAISGLDEAVASRTALSSVMIANPFKGMGLGQRVKGARLAEDAPMMMTACGLALRSFD
jgi:type IV pilus assembly protein PilM